VIVTVPINGSMIGKTLDQLSLGDECKVATVIREDKQVQPSGTMIFMGRDRVLVLGSTECVERAVNKLGEIEFT
jgi:Trk K+ transport system NAD-binding subunit